LDRLENFKFGAIFPYWEGRVLERLVLEDPEYDFKTPILHFFKFLNLLRRLFGQKNLTWLKGYYYWLS